MVKREWGVITLIDSAIWTGFITYEGNMTKS